MCRNLFRFVPVLAVAMLAGCAGTPESAGLEREAPAPRMADAPLGSRVKRPTNIAPTSGGTRNDVEQARVQSGAIATGMAQGRP